MEDIDPINLTFFKKLLNSINIKKFTKIFKENSIKLSPIKNHFYERNVKYTIDDYIIGTIEVLKNYTSWNSYNGKIKGDTIRKKNIEWSKLGIYESLFIDLQKINYKTRKCVKLKYQSMDSTNIMDINGRSNKK